MTSAPTARGIRDGDRGDGRGRVAAGWGARRCVFTLCLAVAASFTQLVRAQDEVRNYRKPILAVETEGHHAPVRSLVWRDPLSLLSGGEDKVVRLWDFRDGPRLVKTIRPAIWRGPAGVIYATALSPRPDGQGQSLLAVAGFGVESRRGDISVYRVPGLAGPVSGELVARILPPREGQPIGHRNSVLCMAFDPSGRVLASGGNDNTVILWDATAGVKVGNATTFRPLRVLAGHTAPVRVLGFVGAEGRRLVTAGQDGTIRLWDVDRGAEVDRNPGNPQRPSIVNALAVSPDKGSFVIGTEGGQLIRFGSGSVSDRRETLLPTRPTQGPIEALAFHPDGRQFAASIKSDRADTLDPMRVACDLEVRSYPDGRVTQSQRVSGLVYSCAYAPDGRRLAYSGGPAQAVYVQDTTDAGRPPLELKGEGTTIYDLGFQASGQAIGFTRATDPDNLPTLYEGFDLALRRSTTAPRDALRRAIRSFNGWTLTGSINEYRLEAVNAGGRRWRADLHPLKEGLWWSYTFLPPGPGHPRPTVAVGCTAGVVVYDLETGRRTRMYAGHSAPVVSVVPSPDGHWLATGSIDQTVQFYPLAGCDTRPVLGATFRQEGNSAVVAGVTPGGFADAAGLSPGDVVVTAGTQTSKDLAPALDQTPRDIIKAFVRRADDLAPNDQVALKVRKVLDVPIIGAFRYDQALGTTKRDGPALTLMLDVSREWVLWTPQGFYDTSIEGDSRLLGWHVNPVYDQSRPTDFFPVRTFAGTMYRPEVIQRLWATRSLEQARAEGNTKDEEVAAESPPLVTFAAADPGVKPGPQGLWEVSAPRARIRVKITAPGSTRISDRVVILGEQVLKPRQAVGPVSEYEEVLDLAAPPNRRARLLVTASNDKQRSRPAFIDLEWKAAEAVPPAPVARLVVLSLGAGTFPNGTLPAIPFADRDAQSLAGFASTSLLAADGTRPTTAAPADRVVLTGPGATAAGVRAAFDALAERLRSKQLKPGDVVAVVVCCHVLEFKGARPPRVAVPDTNLEDPLETSIGADELSDLLGQLADYGCRVVVFLDGVHGGNLTATVRSDVKAWVRDLYLSRRVITIVAAKEGPGGVSVRDRHGLFTLGVENAIRGAAALGSTGRQGKGLTLKQFRDALVQEVLSLSNRQQEAEGYIPPGVPPWAVFVTP
jgi:WD40 repeat protein